MDDPAFLNAIAADPDDDGPRLVYADWLDEHGDRPRAELIRAQCELERLPPADPRRAELEKAARKLLRTHARAWTRELNAAKVGGKSWWFRRGFVHGVTIPAARFVRVADRLFAAAPTVRSVRFPEASNEVTELAACAALARLAEADLFLMCRCGHCRIHDELRDLYASPHAANLTRLGLGGNRIGDGEAADLAAAEALGRLTHLDLRQNALREDGVRHLVASQRLDRLADLDLSLNPLGTAGARALAGAARPRRLTRLVLADCGIGPVGVRALALSPGLGGLASLDLRGNHVGDRGARALAASPHLAGLESLDVSGGNVGPAGAAALRERFGGRVRL